MAGNKP
ncbi:hypothetical protein D039_2619A, partial [Vibrio parahaemolyticus EKP-028]